MQSTRTYKMNFQNNLTICDDSASWPFYFLHDTTADDDRISRLQAEIKRGKYFGVLAIYLDLIRQDKNINRNLVLKKIVQDLEYLQENYKISEK